MGCLRHLAWRRDERTARVEESLVEREQLASVGGEEDLVYEYTGPDTKRAIDESPRENGRELAEIGTCFGVIPAAVCERPIALMAVGIA